MRKVMFEILSLLENNEKPQHSAAIARQLRMRGNDLSERTVRHYFKMLDVGGYTEMSPEKGRRLTEKGRHELNRAFVMQRVGCIADRMNNLAFLTDFSIETLKGKVILNISYVPEHEIQKALKFMSVVLSSPYTISNRIIVRRSGERLGHLTVPSGFAGFGTVSSITINGIFLKAGISISSKYGGVVEVVDNVATRFVSAISYEGSSVAPFEIVIRGKMTDVLNALAAGTGMIFGSFGEIPEISLADAKRMGEKMQRQGFGGALLFGQPGQPLMGLPVMQGKVGVVVLGGLNPVAALDEAHIPNNSYIMGTLGDYSELSSVETIRREYPPYALTAERQQTIVTESGLQG